MLLGRGTNHILSIDGHSLGPGADGLVWHVRATISAKHCTYSVDHDMVIMNSSEMMMTKFVEFAEHRTNAVQIDLSSKGFIRFERDNRGYLHLRYRIAAWNDTGTALESAIEVEGEFANETCREFMALLDGRW